MKQHVHQLMQQREAAHQAAELQRRNERQLEEQRRQQYNKQQDAAVAQHESLQQQQHSQSKVAQLLQGTARRKLEQASQEPAGELLLQEVKNKLLHIEIGKRLQAEADARAQAQRVQNVVTRSARSPERCR